jgi:hypothetical protein
MGLRRFFLSEHNDNCNTMALKADYGSDVVGNLKRDLEILSAYLPWTKGSEVNRLLPHLCRVHKLSDAHLIMRFDQVGKITKVVNAFISPRHALQESFERLRIHVSTLLSNVLVPIDFGYNAISPWQATTSFLSIIEISRTTKFRALHCGQRVLAQC